MTEKGYEVLKCMVKNGFAEQVESVVIASDRNVEKDFFEAIRELCTKSRIIVCDKGSESALPPGVKQMAVGWRWLIESTERNLIVIHDSLLPRYRGFAPLVTQLINGETEIGATMLFASAGYDEGDIIKQASLRITYPIVIADAIKLLCELYCELALTLFQSIKDKKELLGIAQDHQLASYSLWRDEDDYHIDWSNEASAIRRFIDACGTPYLGAYTLINEEKIRIVSAEVVDDVYVEIRQPGKVIFLKNGMPVIVCGNGLLRITGAETYGTRQNILPLRNFRIHLR